MLVGHYFIFTPTWLTAAFGLDALHYRANGNDDQVKKIMPATAESHSPGGDIHASIHRSSIAA